MGLFTTNLLWQHAGYQPAAREIAVEYFNKLKLDVETIEVRSLPVVMATHMLCSLQQ